MTTNIFTTRTDVQAHVLNLLGSEGTEAIAVAMTEQLANSGALTQTDSGLWELADLTESAWLNLLEVASIIGMSIPARWNADQSVFLCAECATTFFDNPDGTIVNEDGDTVAGAEWITDSADLHEGDQCETCGGISTTVWTGSEWVTA